MSSLVWSLSATIAYQDNSWTASQLVYDKGIFTQFGPDISGVPQVQEFISELGLTPNSNSPIDGMTDIVFRFSSIYTNSSIDVLGSTESTNIISNNKDAMVDALLNNPQFSSTLLSAQMPNPPQPTIYFKGGGDLNWDNINNWYLDAGFTIPSLSLPGPSDTVASEVLLDFINSNDPNQIHQVRNLVLFGTGLSNITVQASGACYFQFFYAFGNVTLNSRCYLDGNSLPTALGNIVNGTCYFYGDNATNEGIINGNAYFYDSSSNIGDITGTVYFYDSSSNDGVIDGDAYFNNSSYNLGSVTGRIYCNTSEPCNPQ